MSRTMEGHGATPETDAFAKWQPLGEAALELDSRVHVSCTPEDEDSIVSGIIIGTPQPYRHPSVGQTIANTYLLQPDTPAGEPAITRVLPARPIMTASYYGVDAVDRYFVRLA